MEQVYASFVVHAHGPYVVARLLRTSKGSPVRGDPFCLLRSHVLLMAAAGFRSILRLEEERCTGLAGLEHDDDSADPRADCRR